MSALDTAPARKSTTPRGKNVRTVLLVTNDEGSQQSLQSILTGSLWQLVGARDVIEALKRVQEDAPDLIVCNRTLPDGCWLDVHRLLADHGTRPPIIVTAADVNALVWGEAINLGASNVLAQPFDARDVLWVLSMTHTHPGLQ